LLLLPIFTRAHWLVAALTKSGSRYEANIHDSAPSPPVRRDVEKTLPRLFPNVHITFVHGPHQQRGSDDCGLFMLATIATYLIRNIDPTYTPKIDPATTPTRLRRFLSSSVRTTLKGIQNTLSPALEGGAVGEDSMEARKARTKQKDIGDRENQRSRWKCSQSTSAPSRHTPTMQEAPARDIVQRFCFTGEHFGTWTEEGLWADTWAC
jgi:hypothetical protein